MWAVLAVRLLINFEIFIKILIPRQGEKSMVDDWWWCGVVWSGVECELTFVKGCIFDQE